MYYNLFGYDIYSLPCTWHDMCVLFSYLKEKWKMLLKSDLEKYVCSHDDEVIIVIFEKQQQKWLKLQ